MSAPQHGSPPPTRRRHTLAALVVATLVLLVVGAAAGTAVGGSSPAGRSPVSAAAAIGLMPGAGTLALLDGHRASLSPPAPSTSDGVAPASGGRSAARTGRALEGPTLYLVLVLAGVRRLVLPILRILIAVARLATAGATACRRLLRRRLGGFLRWRLAALAVAAAASLATGGIAGEARSPSIPARPPAGDGRVSILVTLRAHLPDRGYAARPRKLVQALQRLAEESQRPLVSRLGRPTRRLWLVNALSLRARPGEIARIARDPAVARVEEDRKVRLVRPSGEDDPMAAPASFASGDWGLAAIGAPAVWRDYGLDGTGIRVGSIDTGVDPAHPDLAGKVAAWHDFVAGRPLPYDDNGHGTHTIGTMVGGASEGAPIGVAPGARAVVAKALDRDGGATLSTLIAAAQWITDPDGDPATKDYPAVVNASWGCPALQDGGALRAIIRRWRELGIVPVFAAGNSGPHRGSVALPAAYPETLAVAALDPHERVASFSSRGPLAADAAHTHPFEARSAEKPDLAAPGVDVVSATPGGDYVSRRGTSMAAPHVAGLVALLRQADPALSVGRIEALLRQTARDAGPPGPDGEAGAGLVDALAAVRALRGPAASHTGLVVIATPPAVTNLAAPSFAVATDGAPVQVRVDGRPLAPQQGPIVRAPVRSAGRHTVALAALDADGAPIGPPRRFALTIDRTPPGARLVVRRRGLLGVAYRVVVRRPAEVVPGSVSVQTSDGYRLSPIRGRHMFTETGPYWVEVTLADRAGNVRRLRSGISWPASLVARRLAWEQAFLTLDLSRALVHSFRRADGSYPRSGWLAKLLAGNVEGTPFVALPRPGVRTAPGVVGVFSAGRRLDLWCEQSGRRYLLDETAGRLRRTSQPVSANPHGKEQL